MKNVPRRIVTGIKDGKSVITEDQIVENAVEHLPGLIISDIWNSNKMPASLGNAQDIPNTGLPQVPKNGTYFRYVVIPPDKELGIDWEKGALHPLMHQTDTLDYIILLSGELHLILEGEETVLHAGDIVIQRGTNHAWSNRSSEPCIQLAVLVDAEK